MYLHIGNGKVLRKKDVIGIFDMDKTTMSKITKNFLSGKDKAGMVESVCSDIPRSFVITSDGKVYISQISSQSIGSRAEQIL